MPYDRKAAAEQNTRCQELYDQAHAAGLAAQREAERRVEADREWGGPWVRARLILLEDEAGFVRWLRRHVAGPRRGGGAVITAAGGVNVEAVSWAYLNAFDQVIAAAGISSLRESEGD